ncbi:methyl-accepting chemotaxis protein [Massilia sp. TS11]|uniref:methyl-accepting chemotaxis protein n=1 Tax=Massilia sp. TS11 TaxID=2908003 RepID=UPI001EDACCF7|nr:methyl-accepting chemotaxis protein [Massilia sp. TS11]MCG2583326.1 methyl-accepting chemotaxis protein [Massilia sp. TS11]
MDLRNFKIGTRLGMGFGAILLILVVTVAMTAFLNYNNKATLRKNLDVTGAKLLQASNMKSAMLETGLAMRNIGLQADVELMQKEEQKVKEQRKKYDSARDKLQSLGLDDGEKKILADIAKLDADVDAAFKEAIGQVLAFNSEGGAKVIATRIDPLNNQTLAALNKLVDIQQAAEKDAVDKSVKSDNQLLMLQLGLTLAAVALGVVGAYATTRSITRPLAGAVEVAQKVANGDISMNIYIAGNDETSELFQTLKDMTGSLARTVGDVRLGTETITVASQEIAQGNADLSARTESQASSLEETASSMEALTSTVKQNADNARQANQLAVSASSVAEKGGTVVSQVVETMGAIKDSSRKIVDIISVIDGIAFQTNILALNAAVEAARAGEQGRGFAVVAGEVRNLAQRSASAAKEIKALIDDSVEKVDSGSKLVDEAGQTMELIVTSIRQVADIMGEITAATAEQSAGIEEVNAAITQMDEMTQQNAALVEEAAAAAMSMQEQAQKLAEAVAIFQLADAQMRRALPTPAPVVKAAPKAMAAPRPAIDKPSAPAPAPAAKKKAAPPPSNDDWEEF